MIPIKFCFNGEVRRVALQVQSPEKITFDSLKNTACSLFANLEGKEVTFLWNDDDGDAVHCSTDEEIKEAIRVMDVEYKSAYRFDMKSVDPKGVQPKHTEHADHGDLPIHRQVTCDCCGVFPIVGSRFKCTIREDFDLCEACESAVTPPFPMIKIYNPAQTPVAIVVKIKENGMLVKRVHPIRNSSCRVCVGECTCQLVTQTKKRCEKAFKDAKDVCMKAKDVCEQKINEGFKAAVDTSIKYDKAIWRSQKHAEKAAKRASEHAEKAAKKALKSMTTSFVPLGSFVQSFSADRSLLVAPPAAHSSQNHLIASVGPTAEELIELEQIRSSSSTKDAGAGGMVAVKELSGAAESAASSDVVVVAAARVVATLPNSASSSAPNQIVSKASACANGFSMRFVSDITVADGSILVGGKQAIKHWCVRNDGESAWDADVQLQCSGGDDLVPPGSSFSVPHAVAGEEVLVSLPFVAPSTIGRHVAYFRLMKDGKFFGQRLWIDFRVENCVEEEEEVEGLEGYDSAAKASDRDVSASTSAEVEGEVSSGSAAPAVDDEVVSENGDWQVVGNGNASSGTGTISAPEPDPAPLSVVAPVVPAIPTYATELAALADMGFTDQELLLPILQRHVGIFDSPEARINALGVVVNFLMEM